MFFLLIRLRCLSFSVALKVGVQSSAEGSYGLKCLLESIWIVAHGDFAQGGKRAVFVCAERRKIDGAVQKVSDE